VGRFAFNSDSDNEALTIPCKPINAVCRIVDNSGIGAVEGGKEDPNGLGSWGGHCCNCGGGSRGCMDRIETVKVIDVNWVHFESSCWL